MAAVQLPPWVIENQSRFLQAHGPRPASASSAIIHPDLKAFAGRQLDRAVASGMLTTDPRIAPPDGPIGSAAFFRNIENHPDVLATILDTARVAAGFNPATGPGNNTDREKATQQHEAFIRWIDEVDRYAGYLALTASATRVLDNSHHDCNTLIKAITDTIESALGNSGQGLAEKIKDMVISAADYVMGGSSSSSNAYDVGFEMLNLPAVEPHHPKRDPSTALCLSVVSMSRSTTSGKHGGTVLSESFLITTVTYRLVSSVIIDNAERLAGATIRTAERLEATMNIRL